MTATSLAFCLAFAAGAFLALGKHPIFGLVTYVGAFYLSPADRWWGEGPIAEVRWSLLAAALTLLSMLIHKRKVHSATFWRRPPVAAMLLFVGWLVLQQAWALDRDEHEGELPKGQQALPGSLRVALFHQGEAEDFQQDQDSCSDVPPLP